MNHLRRLGEVLAAIVVTILAVGRTEALTRDGPIEVSGNLSAQNEIRTPDVDQYSLVQQRNTLKIRIDYDLLDRGRLMERFDLPFIEKGKLFLLYRGVYDSVYDIKPGIPQKDIYGREINNAVYANFPPFPGFPKFYSANRLDNFPGADGLRFENRMREAYLDIKLKTLPLSFRVGRQQIVWGETDNFRMLDRVNALDMTWHLQQESWDELRIPYWMIKGLWNLDQIGPLSSAFIEAYWNPGDWYPAKQAFLPQPWGLPILNPLNSAMGLTGLHRLYHGTKLFEQGDYHRDPGDNSQVGVRFSAVTPQGVQFTLNYFYQRWADDDGTDAAAQGGITDRNAGNAAIDRGELPIVAVAPYVHTVGASLNYAEEEYTQTVFRAETIYEMGVPFNDFSKPLQCTRADCALIKGDVFGISKRDMWNGMLAFDRPTWIRPLNRKSTFLILGQFFWHYLVDDPSLNPGQHRGFRGQFSSSTFGLPPFSPPAVYDRVREWEVLTTLAATTFYQGGKIVPLFVYILDPVNKFNMEFTWGVDYFLTNNLIVNLSQKYFVNTTSAPVYESWGVAGVNRGRSETGIRLTYQF